MGAKTPIIVHTSLRLPVEQLDWLDERAKEDDRSRSYIVRKLIEKAMAEGRDDRR